MKAESAGKVWRDGAIVAGMIAATILLPVGIHGYLSWLKFDYFSLSSYIPHEAARAELASPTLAKIVSLPLVEMNMTSGHILANMYTLTLGQLALSVTLGLVMGLVFAGQLSLRGQCARAASTGLLGCCGGAALTGGVFALAGLSSATAAALAQSSPIIEVALIVLFGWLYARLRRTGVQSGSASLHGPRLQTE
jgi:hypothetical protein